MFTRKTLNLQTADNRRPTKPKVGADRCSRVSAARNTFPSDPIPMADIIHALRMMRSPAKVNGAWMPASGDLEFYLTTIKLSSGRDAYLRCRAMVDELKWHRPLRLMASRRWKEDHEWIRAAWIAELAAVRREASR